MKRFLKGALSFSILVVGGSVALAWSWGRGIPNSWDFAKDGVDLFPLLDFSGSPAAALTPGLDPAQEQEISRLYEEVSGLCREKKWPEARAAVDKLLARWGSHPIAAEAFNLYVSHLASEPEMKDKALDACRELIRRFPNYTWQAYSYIQNITGSQLYFYNYGQTSMEPGQPASIQLNGYRVKRVDIKVHRVDLFEMIDQGISPLTPTLPRSAKLVKSFTYKPKGQGSDYFYDNVPIPLPGPGAYIISLGTEHYQWMTMVLSTRLALLTKGDGRILLAYAGNMRGGGDCGEAEIVVMDQARKIYRGRTNSDGLFVGRVKGRAENALVVARRGDDWAVSHAQSYYDWGSYGQVFVATDRPVYRPKQPVHVRLIIRRFNSESGKLEFTPGEQLQVSIRDPRWNEAFKKNVKVGEFGSAEFTWELGERPPLGAYQIQIGGNNLYGYGQFHVEEYKKPEYEVEVTTGKKHAVRGDKIDFTVTARYYFGEPVQEAEVKWEVYSQVHSYYRPFWGRWRDYDWFYEYYSPKSGYGGGQLVASGKGKLDRQGKLTFSFDSEKVGGEGKEHEYDSTLSVRVSVVDKSRRQIQGYASLYLARAALQLSLEAGNYSYRPGEKVSVRARTTDLEGRGIPSDVSFDVRRMDDSGNYRSHFRRAIATDSNGFGELTFTAEKSGYYQIDGKARDRAGREITSSVWLWIAAENWRSPYNYSGLELKTDQSIYQPGDRARIIVTSGYLDHPVLVTTEGDRLLGYRLARFSGSLLQTELPIDSSYAPSATVSANLFADGSFVSTQAYLVVPPADKWLKVKIETSKPQYKPGEPAAYTITLTDHRDRPVVAELSFALVDEAIYAIQPDNTPDVRQFFHGQRYHYVTTQTSFWFQSQGLGAAPAKQAAEAPAGAPAMEAAADRLEARPAASKAAAARGAGAGEEMVQPRLRTEFADSAVWRPAVVTDAAGRAEISFTMPDNLTTWRAKVIAITREGLVGQETHKVITRQNLMVRLECPRKFTERDQVTVSAVVHNYLKAEKLCRVALQNEGGTLKKGERQLELRIPSGGEQRVDWLLSIDTHRPVKLAVSALTDEESDAMQLVIPVIPHGLRLIQTAGGAVSDGSQQVTLALPAEVEKQKSLLTISLSPSLAATMLESLEYLAGYPYGCVEQTMSRFLPSVMVAKILQKMNIENAELKKNLPKYVEGGLRRLYDFQHGDGGWGWWKEDQTNPYMSAYVVYGLALAREADFAVDGNVLERGLDYLQQSIPQEKDLNTRAYMVLAYAQSRAPRRQWLDELSAGSGKLSDYALALLVQARQKAAKLDGTAKLIGELEHRAAVAPTVCHWGKDEAYYDWQSNSVQATSQAMRALVAHDPRHPLLPKAVAWLVEQRRENYWYSTKDTAAAIFALADYMKSTSELSPDYRAAVTVNGKTVKEFNVRGPLTTAAPTIVKLEPEYLRSGENKVQVEKRGRGNLYFSCTLEYYAVGEDLPPTRAGLVLKRQYQRLVTKKKGGTPVVTHLPLRGEIKGGDEIEVTLTVKADKPYRYLVLEDMLPAGCEVVEDKSELGDRYRYWWRYYDQREARDDRMVFFLGYLGTEERIFTYVLRAETPGEFHVMPAAASLMYQPEVRATSAEYRMSIFEK